MATFNAKSTTTDVAAAYASIIKDKVILTTGVSPNSLGACFVETMANRSPKLLILAGRNVGKLQQTADAIHSVNRDVQIRLLTLDLADQGQIRQAAKEVLSYEENIDVLMNNAAVMAQPYSTTKDGLESQFGSNHIGHFLFTNLIMPKVLASPHSRIINVSSAGHRFSPIRFDDPGFSNGAKYNKWEGYGQAKTANILFSVELARRYASRGLLSYSLHPGSVWTNLGTHLNEEDFADVQAMDRKLGNQEGERKAFEFKSLDQGTATHVFASFSPDIVHQNGAYLLDCRVAKLEEIRSKAIDPDNAKKLWTLSETLVGEKFSD